MLRPAAPDDLDELLRWRNDPITRHYRNDDRIISPAEHADWFATNRSRLYIYDNKGQIKLDGAGEIGWIVAPQWRGQGVGKAMLAVAVELLSPRWCKIREDNTASIRLARSCGFEFTEQEGRMLYYRT